MAPKATVLDIDGRAVTITNPDKVFFPKTGHTKLDLVNYYLSVADGALRGVHGRPMALKRFVNGAEGEPFFQKRVPNNAPEWIETVRLSYPSGGVADEIVVRDAAVLAWVVNLGCIDLNPHPVRAEDIDRPDELRVDLDPIRGVGWSQVREVAMVVKAVLDDFGLVGWPKTSGSRGFHIFCRIEPRWLLGPRYAWRYCAGARSRAAGARPGDQQVVEGRAARRIRRLQPERARSDDVLGVLRATNRAGASIDAAAVGRGAKL
jgi:bifunctional non-homologous end joining protein LigD